MRLSHSPIRRPASRYQAQVDAVPFDVKAGNNQPIWVDLLVPTSAEPGKYSGAYTVTSNQGNFTGSISVKVWNFALPALRLSNPPFCFSGGHSERSTRTIA